MSRTETDREGCAEQRKFGLDQGKIVIRDDFDEPLQDWSRASTGMSKVENLEQEIRKLSPQELAELRAWFLEYDAELWDRQIEEDARAGRLDRFAGSARTRSTTDF